MGSGSMAAQLVDIMFALYQSTAASNLLLAVVNLELNGPCTGVCCRKAHVLDSVAEQHVRRRTDCAQTYSCKGLPTPVAAQAELQSSTMLQVVVTLTLIGASRPGLKMCMTFSGQCVLQGVLCITALYNCRTIIHICLTTNGLQIKSCQTSIRGPV